jgi:MFS family permease
MRVNARSVLTVAGVVAVLSGSLWGVAQQLSMSTGRLMGMALDDMPEMWVVAAGLVLVAVAAALPRSPRTVSRKANRTLAAVVALFALGIDVSKTSTLGFVLPGMRQEYGLSPTEGSLLAVAGLTGATLGALLVGLLADRIGRRTSFLLAVLAFTGTSLCGSMPDFRSNLVMCGLMGVAVGALAPLLVTMIGDMLHGSTRGPFSVAIAVLAVALGYGVAAGGAYLLEAEFGWRILWLVGAPTGALLVLMTPWVPEPHAREAKEMAVTPVRESVTSEAHRAVGRSTLTLVVQMLYAAVAGLVTFGLTTWVPTLARSTGLSSGHANGILATTALWLVPAAFVLALAYRRWGPVVVVTALAITTAAFLVVLVGTGTFARNPSLSAVALTAVLITVNAMSAIYLPVAADLAATSNRARATGLISGSNRFGGLLGPLVLSALVGSIASVLLAVAVLAAGCCLLACLIFLRQRRVRRVHITPLAGVAMSDTGRGRLG